MSSIAYYYGQIFVWWCHKTYTRTLAYSQIRMNVIRRRLWRTERDCRLLALTVLSEQLMFKQSISLRDVMLS